MKFQDILKIKRANIKVLFCSELIEPPILRNELIDDLTDIKNITIKNIIYQNGKKAAIGDSVKDATYVAKYSSFEELKKLLWDSGRLLEEHGRVIIDRNGERKYIATSKSNKPVIYFWISEDRIFYVGKAGNGWSNRSKQHQNGWNRKAKEKRKSENIFPENPTEFAVVTIPVNKLTIEGPTQLKALSPFEKRIPQVPVDIIDELEKIFIFICQPQINTTLKNGDGVNFEILKNIL